MISTLAFLITTLTSIPISNSVFFNIPSFDSNTSSIIVYEGDAAINNGSVELNRVDYLCRVGRATLGKPIQMYDPSTGKPSDFTTTFTFTVDTFHNASFGDGFSFFLAPAGTHIPFNSACGFQGLYNMTTLESPSENQLVAVEFDSRVNFRWDPPYEHVGINVNSLTSATHVSWNFSAHSGQVGRANITYNSGTRGLSVVISYDGQIHNSTHELHYEIDLMKILPQWVTVGFSASTGMVNERHIIHTWEFSSTFDAQPIRIGAERSHSTRVNVWLIISSFSMGFLLFVFLSWPVIWIRKRIRPSKESVEAAMLNHHLSSMTCVLDRGAWPRKFSHRELVKATNNFSDEKKLGQGGFGSVYKGVLDELNNMEIAVKKISNGSKQGKKEYLTEVLIISSLRHRNLVRLIGWCHDQGEFLLVYELMPNGSLDFHLFGNRTTLTWDLRYKIALGLASALLYLHEEWEQCVIHRDIKPSNVMLDSSFNAKLGDFGLARLVDHEVSLQTTAFAGTYGYLAPEYISRDKASKECDVYSFGVVALEIACGRRSVEHNVEELRVSLLEWVWCLHGEGRIVDAGDERLGQVFDGKEMERLLVVGLWCAHPDHNLRPCIKEAIQVLKFEADLPRLPMAMPVLVYGAPLKRLDHSSHGSITSTSIENGR